MVVWSSNALQHIPEEILGGSKEWVVSIFMIGAGLVPWFASEKITIASRIVKKNPASAYNQLY